MKNVHPFVWVLAAILLWGMWQISVAIFTNHPIRNYPPKGTHIIALGDSLVVGVGAGKSEAGFVPVLARRLNIAIVNKGMNGNTTHDALLRLQKDVLDEKPDIVMILLGGNDFLKQVPAEETFANLRLIISQIQSQGAIVLLLGIRGGPIADHYDDNFTALAKETGSLYISNVLDGLIGNSAFMSDEIHPNDKGYEKIADRIAPILEGLIAVAPTPPAEAQ